MLRSEKIREVSKKREQLKEKEDQLRNDFKGALPNEMYAEIMKVKEESRLKKKSQGENRETRTVRYTVTPNFHFNIHKK